MIILENIAALKRQEILKNGTVAYDGDVNEYNMTRATTLKFLISSIDIFLNRHQRKLENLLVVRNGSTSYFLATSTGDPEVVFYYYYDAYGFKSYIYIGWNKIDSRKFVKLPADQQDKIWATENKLDPVEIWKRERSLAVFVTALKTLTQEQVLEIMSGVVTSRILNYIGKFDITVKNLNELGTFVKYMKELATPETKKIADEALRLFKRSALKKLMETVREYHKYPRTYGPIVNGDIKLLRSKGAKWPELDVIEKSISQKSNVSESESEVDLDHYRKILKQGKIWSIDDMLDDFDEAGIPELQQYTIVKSLLPEILVWFKLALVDRDPEDAIDLIYQLTSEYHLYDMRPSVKNILDKHKTSILRNIMNEIKTKGNPLKITRQLYYFEVTWPELTVIVQNIKAKFK